MEGGFGGHGLEVGDEEERLRGTSLSGFAEEGAIEVGPGFQTGVAAAGFGGDGAAEGVAEDADGAVLEAGIGLEGVEEMEDGGGLGGELLGGGVVESLEFGGVLEVEGREGGGGRVER